jgi:hypothetical protein
MRIISAAYYATLLAIGAGLTAFLGYEIGWLAAHSRFSLLVAGTFVPWVLVVAWDVGAEQ